MKDPQFGWHVYWIAPLFILGAIVGDVISLFKRAKIKPKKIWTEEQKRLQVLAGIREDQE